MPFFITIHFAKFDNSEISAVELGVLMLRAGGSLRCWFGEFLKEKKLELGDKVCGELCLWIRAYEFAGCYDQLNLGGNASLEHMARVIQSFVDAPSDSASVTGCFLIRPHVFGVTSAKRFHNWPRFRFWRQCFSGGSNWKMCFFRQESGIGMIWR